MRKVRKMKKWWRKWEKRMYGRNIYNEKKERMELLKKGFNE